MSQVEGAVSPHVRTCRARAYGIPIEVRSRCNDIKCRIKDRVEVRRSSQISLAISMVFASVPRGTLLTGQVNSQSIIWRDQVNNFHEQASYIMVAIFIHIYLELDIPCGRSFPYALNSWHFRLSTKEGPMQAQSSHPFHHEPEHIPKLLVFDDERR